MQLQSVQLTLFLAVVAVVALVPLPAAAAGTSKYFGAAGEKWSPTGPFIDFRYAGKRFFPKSVLSMI